MQTIDKHFRALVEPVFQKHGFAQADLLSHWPQIVGEDAARLASPERIRWPRGSEGRQPGGTLFLKAVAGRGLEVQHAIPLFLERINRFLGYGAIVAIKVTQGHEAPAGVPQKPAPAPISAETALHIAQVEDPDLQDALARLAQGIADRSKRSPQAK